MMKTWRDQQNSQYLGQIHRSNQPGLRRNDPSGGDGFITACVENAMKMLTDEGPFQRVSVCDAECGTGCLAIPLVNEGAIVTAADISASMVVEAEKQAKEQLQLSNGFSARPLLPKFEVKDLESSDGKYDTVVCLDVLIHYPHNKADGMIAHLASLPKFITRRARLTGLRREDSTGGDGFITAYGVWLR